jgi:hypothetical protein
MRIIRPTRGTRTSFLVSITLCSEFVQDMTVGLLFQESSKASDRISDLWKGEDGEMMFFPGDSPNRAGAAPDTRGLE